METRSTHNPLDIGNTLWRTELATGTVWIICALGDTDMGSIRDRGFASLTDEQKRAVASKGGKAAHAKGRAHQWDAEAARLAGRKGGRAGRGKVKARTRVVS